MNEQKSDYLYDYLAAFLCTCCLSQKCSIHSPKAQHVASWGFLDNLTIPVG